MTLIALKLSALIFGDGDEVDVPMARKRASRFGVSREEFRPFRKELSALGVAELVGSGRSLVLKRLV